MSFAYFTETDLTANAYTIPSGKRLVALSCEADTPGSFTIAPQNGSAGSAITVKTSWAREWPRDGTPVLGGGTVLAFTGIARVYGEVA